MDYTRRNFLCSETNMSSILNGISSFIRHPVRETKRAAKKVYRAAKSVAQKGGAVEQVATKVGNVYQSAVKGGQKAANTVLKAGSDLVQMLLPTAVKRGIDIAVSTIRGQMRDSIDWLYDIDPNLAAGVVAFADVTGITTALETGLLTASVLGGHDLTEEDIATIYPPYRAARETIEASVELSAGNKDRAKRALKKAAVDLIKIAAKKAFKGSGQTR